ncbi:MAG: hypothetical protein ACRDHP_13120, partial [Ktedonobacterales bacterium]
PRPGDPPTLPNAGANGLDLNRIEDEEQRLNTTYQAHGGKATVTDMSGHAVAGYRITVHQPSAVWELVQFELAPDYPRTPPRVTVRPAGGSPMPWSGPLLASWTSAMSLREILAAVLNTVAP